MTSLHASLPTTRPVRTFTFRPFTVPCFQGFGRLGRLGIAQADGRCKKNAQDLPLVDLRSVVGLAGCGRSLLSWPQNGSKWTAMRHGNKKTKLGRPADQRKALLRALTTELLRHGKIKTTKVSATSLQQKCQPLSEFLLSWPHSIVVVYCGDNYDLFCCTCMLQ